MNPESTARPPIRGYRSSMPASSTQQLAIRRPASRSASRSGRSLALGLVVAGSIATGSALAGPPGVPTTERDPASQARETETENRDGVAIVDLRRAPSEARPILETRESLDAAWRPSRAVRSALEIRRLGDWLVVAGPETAVGLFRSWYAELLATTTPGVAVDIRVIELGDAPSTPAILDDLRRDPAGDAAIALAAAVPPDGTLIAEGRLVVPPGGPARFELQDDSGRSTLVEIESRPIDGTRGLELVIDAEVARTTTLGRRTDRTGARATDRRRETLFDRPVATTTAAFGETTVRTIDGGRRTLPSAAPADAPPIVVVATPRRERPEEIARTISPTPYLEGPASRDGIGRRYLGREIAQVMGHLGAGWLERPEREREERTSLLLSMLPVRNGDTVADIGAGSGYFTRRLAGMVGDDGVVVATDIQPEMLEILDRRLEEEGIENVTSRLGTVTDTGIEAGSVDLILLVDVYHEFDHPWEMSRSMLRALRPGGVVALVEYRANDPAVPIKPLHTMTAEQSRLEFEAAGFRLVREEVGDLPWQRLQLFERPRDSVD